MDIIIEISQELGISKNAATNILNLIDEGNTIPFIARYRKEMTSGASDEVLRQFNELLTKKRNLIERKETVTRLIDELDKLTPELEQSIINAKTITEVEDLYRPYKAKRKTRATEAIRKGLKPLADMILSGNVNLTNNTQEFLNEEVTSIEDAIKGACDIVAEIISDDANVRKDLREYIYSSSNIISKAKGEENPIFEMYFDYTEKLTSMPSHRILAINRGESEDALSVKINPLSDQAHAIILNYYNTNNNELKELFNSTIEDSYKRLIFPAIEKEIRNTLTETAHESAINVFGDNLKSLLLQKPLYNSIVIGYDPAYRTGCKLAVTNENGMLLETTTIFPTKPQEKYEASKKTIVSMIKKYNVGYIAIGNGTASRESEEFIARVIKEENLDIKYTIISEAGASVYSASELANQEYPHIDVSLRGAISIAKRLQDPLAELIKIDPKHIGVGQYQHDVNQKRLTEVLDGVIENVVNQVGVNLNTASHSLLTHVAGINKKTAINIVSYRDENGSYKNKNDLLNVKGLGNKSYEQAAGFLRIKNGETPLDNTAIHPSDYDTTMMLLEYLELDKDINNISFDDLDKKIAHIGSKNKSKNKNAKVIKGFDALDTIMKSDSFDKEGYKEGIRLLSKTLEIGEYTLKDIIQELKKPGRDPREDSDVTAVFKKDVLSINDLTPDMILNGVVSNVTDFGAFIDLGVKKDGLVHISKMSKNFVKNPSTIVKVGQVVQVKVIEIDIDKQKIALSMII